uniref:Uncharacterized protein n=1 Tax=Aureoumbra lagunensis TaxID=44058 RepID=A0A7S3K5P5_9STRA|mmetsp:Transcript_4055/g.5690  ORF Transcript_4055/g.5690 Transcript_4055/m.5690 type:complete len:206 (+) Transcript_4055:60-677(+)
MSSFSAAEVKLVLLGDSGVGKSSLAQRYVNKSFKEYSESTIGASFLSKMVEIDKKQFKVQIWDTAGQEKYHSLAPMYYRNALAAVLVFDITSIDSFDRLKKWVYELRDKGPSDLVLAVAGNKCDLHAARMVDTADAETYALSIGAIFFETSAKNDTKVNDLFTALCRSLPDESLNIRSDSTTAAEQFRLDTIGKKNKGGRSRCCS